MIFRHRRSRPFFTVRLVLFALALGAVAYIFGCQGAVFLNPPAGT